MIEDRNRRCRRFSKVGVIRSLQQLRVVDCRCVTGAAVDSTVHAHGEWTTASAGLTRSACTAGSCIAHRHGIAGGTGGDEAVAHIASAVLRRRRERRQNDIAVVDYFTVVCADKLPAVRIFDCADAQPVRSVDRDLRRIGAIILNDQVAGFVNAERQMRGIDLLAVDHHWLPVFTNKRHLAGFLRQNRAIIGILDCNLVGRSDRDLSLLTIDRRLMVYGYFAIGRDIHVRTIAIRYQLRTV